MERRISYVDSVVVELGHEGDVLISGTAVATELETEVLVGVGSIAVTDLEER